MAVERHAMIAALRDNIWRPVIFGSFDYMIQAAPGTCPSELDSLSSVIAGLDPAIHLFTKKMDPRVKPAGDAGE
jgi:hypothetical protein